MCLEPGKPWKSGLLSLWLFPRARSRPLCYVEEPSSEVEIGLTLPISGDMMTS